MTGDLFANEPPRNLLPFDGEVLLLRDIMDVDEADKTFARLQSNIVWQQEIAKLHGKEIPVPRLTAWYGEVAYRYSGVYHPASPFPSIVAPLRSLAEELAGASFNTVLLNQYRDGRDSVSWHADDEEVLGENPVIASLTFGQERRFHFRHKKTGDRLSIDLPHNSALIMSGPTQHCWLHQLPKTARQVGPRINLTFRNTRPESR
ncbi:MAG: alpha-ketoglutarate-dependent dioxygenase AlkB [Thalassospira sp.]|uniref:alpha-ketoglutarate-dependent dioxygenase AlkB family protein n=1 Tax=Thalassospira TaxID=168934 RepID=UPI000C484068|nr:alpha-ketoglutarate-dependent dioxygenase AlkB [Thalassospira sp. UBA4513]MBE69868.1 alpha-ketoglutarate-dependent dioxygenase AlkB [Thalassospira sp.]BDW87516.1 alkylated DNA repair protein [Thalassospira tepidiphila]|tara:strand:- start:1140 stop:1751 length:612 start_codon:yes stop_codon:yes gene_type:complete